MWVPQRVASNQLSDHIAIQPHNAQVRTQLDLGTLPNGVYILTAEQGKRRKKFKILKQ